MKGLKKAVSSRTFSIVSLLIAIILLAIGGIGTARAAFTYVSKIYKAQFDLHDIGVSLLENDEIVSHRDYIGKGKPDNSNLSTNENSNWDRSEYVDPLDDDKYDPLLKRFEEEEFIIGKKYDEVLAVKNTGTINQYVRVSVYKYWLDKDGKRDQSLDPSKIVLNLNGNALGVNGSWVEDTAARTEERTVLYYTKLLKVGSKSEPFADTLKVESDIARIVTQNSETKVVDGKSYTTITNTYAYDEHQFCVQARVDAVQDHNAADAILSAWGRKVSVSGNKLTLK